MCIKEVATEDDLDREFSIEVYTSYIGDLWAGRVWTFHRYFARHLLTFQGDLDGFHAVTRERNEGTEL